jgi:6-phospho-beta-glucosidase
VFVRGADVTHDLIAEAEADGEWPTGLLRSLGAIPCGYHHYYYRGDEMLAKLQRAEAEGKPTRGEQIQGIEKELFDLYRDPDLSEKPEALSKRGGALYSEAAVQLMDSIRNDKRDTQCVDTLNRGTLTDLPDDVVVEVSCVIGREGPRPVRVGRLEPQLRGLLQQIKAYEELAIEAAVTGNREVAAQALLANPLVPSWPKAQALVDDLVEAHAEHLPQFGR